jgi:hypothetical protein
MRLGAVHVLLVAAAVRSGGAQAPARYLPSPDTLRYESLNSYLTYFVRGRDTLGRPVSIRTLEFRRGRAVASGLEFWVRVQGTEPNPSRSEQTYTVTPSGRVLTVDGRPVGEVSNARVDLLPRFAATGGVLEPGVAWNDTVSLRSTESHGPTHYSVRRSYRVLRVVDSAGTRLAQLVAQGDMRLRQGGWQDSAQALVWWQEVAGPVTDTVWFDTRAGRVRASFSVMHLVGSGGFGPRGGGTTMPTGLRSSVRLTIRP